MDLVWAVGFVMGLGFYFSVVGFSSIMAIGCMVGYWHSELIFYYILGLTSYNKFPKKESLYWFLSFTMSCMLFSLTSGFPSSNNFLRVTRMALKPVLDVVGFFSKIFSNKLKMLTLKHGFLSYNWTFRSSLISSKFIQKLKKI